MANERLAQARDLIKAKRYQEARQVLKVIADHPTARTWLAKLDEIAPEVPEDDPFAVFDAPAARPAVKPADAIFDPNPRFDPLPADVSRRRRERLTRALVIVFIVVALTLVVGVYSMSKLGEASARIGGEINATMTQFTHNYYATQTGVVGKGGRSQ